MRNHCQSVIKWRKNFKFISVEISQNCLALYLSVQLRRDESSWIQVSVASGHVTNHSLWS